MKYILLAILWLWNKNLIFADVIAPPGISYNTVHQNILPYVLFFFFSVGIMAFIFVYKKETK